AGVVRGGEGGARRGGQRVPFPAASPGPVGQAAAPEVERRVRLVDDGRHHVFVPAVRIVGGDDDRHALPFRQLLQAVQRVDDERLLVQRVRVSRGSVLIGRRPQE